MLEAFDIETKGTPWKFATFFKRNKLKPVSQENALKFEGFMNILDGLAKPTN